jgi:hypothetical protein
MPCARRQADANGNEMLRQQEQAAADTSQKVFFIIRDNRSSSLLEMAA